MLPGCFLISLAFCWNLVEAGHPFARRYDAQVPWPTPPAKLEIRQQAPNPTSSPSTLSAVRLVNTSITTWSYNACTYNPSRVFASLSCNSTFGLGQGSTYAGTTTSVCDCPDGGAYVLLSGGKTTEKNYQCSALWTAQGGLRVAIPTQCPTPDPPTSTGPSSYRPSFYTSITVKVNNPDRCWSTTLDYSSRYAMQTGSVAISADEKNGWGAQGSQWNLTTNNGVVLQNVRAPCIGSACASWNGVNAQSPGNITQSADKKSWTFSVTPDMQASIKIIADSRGGNGNGSFDLVLTSTPPCGKPIYNSAENWNFTPENWKDANTDDEFKSWALNLNKDAPTGTLTRGTYPTAKAMPKYDSDFGNLATIDTLVGSFISIATGGKSVNCQLIPAGELEQCPGPPSISEAAPNMPRWVFFVWKAIYNLHAVHYAITGVLLSEGALQLGQTVMVVSDFTKPKQPPNVGLAIFLQVLGAVSTVVGIGVAIKGIGAATTAFMRAGDVANAGRVGGLAAGAKGAGGKRPDPVVIPSQGTKPVDTTKPNDGNPRQSDDMAITPATPPPSVAGNPIKVDENKQIPVEMKPEAGKGKDTGFVGNAFLVCPGVMTGMANGIWQQLDKAQTQEAKIQLDQAAVGYYMANTSAIIQKTNDDLLTFKRGNEDATKKLLDVLKDGTFIAPIWDTYVYQTSIAADVVSRQINVIWQGGGYNTYVQYTFLDDDDEATKCSKLRVGPVTTQYCADGGVYYTTRSSYTYPPWIQEPYGFDKLLDYGINLWWPTAGSAKTYRAMNPDPNKLPVKMKPDEDGPMAEAIQGWVSNNAADALNLIGTTPGTWSFPVCDQGKNFHIWDWADGKGSEKGFKYFYGDVANDGYYWPCSCGYHGGGTKAFYDALQLKDSDLGLIATVCGESLLNIDPAIQADKSKLTKDMIGWNNIVGGKPPGGTKIVYGDCDGCSIEAPDDLPDKLCHMFERPNGGCPNEPPRDNSNPICNLCKRDTPLTVADYAESVRTTNATRELTDEEIEWYNMG